MSARRSEHREGSAGITENSPLVFSLRHLGVYEKPGAWASINETVPAPAELKIEVIGVPEGSDVRLDLQLESVVEGIYVSGTVQAVAKGEDIRSLEPLELPLTVDISELFPYEGEDDEELYPLNGDRLDFEPALRDAIVMALPFRPTRHEDDTTFSYTLGEDLDDSEAETADPRWSALTEFLDEKKES